MKAIYLSLIFISFGFMISCHIASAKALTFDEFISEVKSSNPSILATKFHALAEANRIDPNQSFDDPFFAFGVDQVPTSGADSTSMNRYQISQSISFPGKLSARGKIAKNRATSAQADSETTLRQTIVFATQSYYKAIFIKHSLELNQKIKSLLEETIESTKTRYKTGGQSHHEWLSGKLEMSILGVERLRLHREQKSSQALLNELRNQKANVPIEIVETIFKDNGESITPDLNAQPELKAALAQASTADSEARFAKLSYFPDFTFQGMLEQPRNPMMDQSNSWGVMVGVSLPIFFLQKQSELLAAANNERESALAEKTIIQNRLNTEITNATEQLGSARDILKLYMNEVLPMTELALKNAQTTYSANRAPLSQLIETLKAKRTQEIELLGAQIDVELAKLRLREVLTSPPTMRFAPFRPTLFGGQNMGDNMESSGTLNMGRGLSGPTRKAEKSGAPSGSNKNMGGM